MWEFLLEDDGRGDFEGLLIACLIAAAVLVAIWTIDPLVDAVRQIIQTEIM
jgi:hypothetical protein